jgi:alkylated DNA repair dioxygenase AlkB
MDLDFFPRDDMKSITMSDGCVLHYLCNFLSQGEANRCFDRLFVETPWEREEVVFFGRRHILERRTAQYGRDYKYNAGSQPAHSWTSLMSDLRTMVERATGEAYTSALCNLYPNGSAYIGWHMDAGHPRLIASVSLGAIRTLKFARVRPMEPIFKIKPEHGSLLLIPRKVNDVYKHSVAKSVQCMEPRINITFRAL